jgi:RimJ/RimL family protein N-acetyltransferase
MKYLIYKLNKANIGSSAELKGVIKIWKPSLSSMKFQRLPDKYVFWWFFHYFCIFKSKELAIYSYYIQNKLAHFFCLVPKYYRWPFMNKNDMQVTYVITEKEFLGQGIAYSFISSILSSLSISGDIWYVTDDTNLASQALAKKIGFEFVGYGVQKKYFKGLIKKINFEK